MPTMNDDNSARVSASVNVRTAAIVAVVTLLCNGAFSCSRPDRSDEIVSRLDRLESKVDAKLDAVTSGHVELSIRLARVEGAHGAPAQ